MDHDGRGGRARVHLRSARTWWTLAAASVAAVVALALTDTAVARSADDLGSLHFGAPLPWLTQQASTLDPPDYPWRLPFGSPWEIPTHVQFPELLADMLVTLVALTAAWWLVAIGIHALRGRTAGPS